MQTRKIRLLASQKCPNSFQLIKVFRLLHAQVVDYYQENLDYGLMMRFKGCSEASYDWVIIHDDDVMLSRQGLQALILAKVQDPDRLFGFHGRGWTTETPS